MAWNPFRRRVSANKSPARPVNFRAGKNTPFGHHAQPPVRTQPVRTTSRRRSIILAGVALAGAGILGIVGKIIGLGPRPLPPIVTPGNGHSQKPPTRREPLPRITPEPVREPIPVNETPEQRARRTESERIERERIANQERIQKLLDKRKEIPFFDAENSWNGLKKFSSVYTKKEYEFELDANGFPSKPAWVLGQEGNFSSALRDGSVVAIKRVNAAGLEETSYMMFHANSYYYLPENGQGGKIGHDILNQFLSANYNASLNINAQVVGVFHPKK